MAGRFAWVMAVGAAALLGGCSLGRPVPGFTFSPESGTAPLSVQFINTSTGGGPFGIEWSWNFGDGTPADTAASPAHVYAAAGEYSVTLTMKTWRGNRSMVGGPVSVLAAPDPVPVFTVDFSASPTAGAAPLTTQFANETVFSGKCDAVWSWDFGDGSALSAEASPAHVYAVPGTYAVRLTAQVGSVVQTKEKAGYVVVTQTPDPGAEPVLERTVSPAAYTPGGSVTVTLRVLYSGTPDITALGIQEILPDGWTYSGVSGDGAPPVSPSSGATGTLNFAYVAVPSFPVEFSYAVLPPTVANGMGTFSGQVLYRTTGGEQVSQPCVTEVFPAGGGEGEGEGEGEPILTGVPDLSGLPIEEVAGVLAESNLVLGGVSGVWSDTVELGRVVGQTPVPGAMVALDSAVAVSISEVARATLLHLSRTTDPAGVYAKGGQVRVVVTLDRVGSKPVAPLQVFETLPEGWSYGDWGDEQVPDSFPLAGDTDTLVFSWEDTGAFPWTFSYTVNVPPDAAGLVQLSGKAVYDAGNGVLESNTETTPLWPEGGGGLVLARTVGGTGAWIPDEALEVTLTVFTAGVFTGTLTSFGLEEMLPEGWVYDGVASASTPPAGAGVPPETNTLGIFWITPPPLPLTVVYRLIPDGENSVACMQGQAIYFVGGGGQQRSNAEVTCLSEGLAP